MIGTITVKVNAARPNMPLDPIFSFKGSPSSLRIMDVPKGIGKWTLNAVKVIVKYPDDTTITTNALRNGSVWVATFEGNNTVGKSGSGYKVVADGLDENGNDVTGYVLGVGDLYVLDNDTNLQPLVDKSYVKYCASTPSTPMRGDLIVVVEDGNTLVKIYDGTEWKSQTLFTKTSDLVNDSGFITASAIPSSISAFENDVGYITASAIPMNISAFENDVGYITSEFVEPYTTIQGATGYAKKATQAWIVGAKNIHNNGTEFPIALTTSDDGTTPRGLLQRQYLVNWNLSQYDQTTYSTPIPLVWKYMELTRNRSGRPITVYQGYGWISDPDPDGKRYAIGCANVKNTADPNNFYYDDGTGNLFSVTKELTLDETTGNSISSLEGGTTIICTRSNQYWHTSSQLLATVDDIPTNTSDLVNDSDFITSSAIPSNVGAFANDAGYITASAIPSTLGAFSNDVGYITSSAIPSNVSEFNNDVGYLSAVSWNDIQNKPAIPSTTNDLTNDSGFITASAIPSNVTAFNNDAGYITASAIPAIPSKTSDLTNDSGFITSADIITKRDLNDLNIYADPMAEHTPIEVTVWHNDEISTLYTLNWDGSSWYYTDGSTNIQIYFDGYSNHYILTGSVQDMGGTQRSINGQFDLTSPLWSVTFETQYFYKIEVASIKAHIVTREYVDSRLSALEARIAALENN